MMRRCVRADEHADDARVTAFPDTRVCRGRCVVPGLERLTVRSSGALARSEKQSER